MRIGKVFLHIKNLEHNFLQLQSWLRRHGGTRVPRICVSVKASAYGHGMEHIAPACQQLGCTAFAVASVGEGVHLRTLGITVPIYLCALCLPEEVPDLVFHHITPLITDTEIVDMVAAEARKQERRVPIHLKVDTGMGRLGVVPAALPELLNYVLQKKELNLQGIATHCSSADSDPDFTARQLESFRGVAEPLRKEFGEGFLLHCANSATCFAEPSGFFDMVRCGLALYGYLPLPVDGIDMKPVMEFRSKVVAVRRHPANSPISYHHQYHTDRESYIATIPSGYGDGINRLLSGRAEVLIAGKRYPIVGIICMDHLMVNTGNTNPRRFSDVTVFGPDPQGPDAQELADIAGTIPYEILTNISAFLQRVRV